MAKKTSAPALYELIRSRRAEPPRRVKPPRPERPPGEVRDWLSWLSAGRAIRAPVGYLLLGLAGCLVLLVAAYIFGYTRAGRVGAIEGVTSLSEANRHPGPEVAPDPAPVEPIRQPVLAAPQVPQMPTAPAGQASIFDDPRLPGKSYFVIAETNVAGAERLALYCRGQGLEAYVIGGNDDRFRKVIVLPGFEPQERSSPRIKALEDRIHQVGDRWKSAERGASNLRDAYPLQFKGHDKKA